MSPSSPVEGREGTVDGRGASSGYDHTQRASEGSSGLQSDSYGRLIPARRTDPETSHRADDYVAIPAKGHRGRLLIAYAQVSDATDNEAAVRAGLSMTSNYWKRCSELREAGLIAPTGAQRPGQAGTDRLVCAITDRGRAVLRGEAVMPQPTSHRRQTAPLPPHNHEVRMVLGKGQCPRCDLGWWDGFE